MTTRTKHRSIEFYEAARIRTEMFLGSRELHTEDVLNFDGKDLKVFNFTWVPALWTCLREIIDNAVDEMIAHGHGNKLQVTYDRDNFTFTIEDNGNGLPIDEIKEVGKGPAASIMLARAFSGDNFDADRESMAGMNGVGASIVNFTSEFFELEVYGTLKDGTPKKLTQRWEEGVYGGKPIHKTKGPHIIRGSRTKKGTKITFKPSAKVFSKMQLPWLFVLGRMWDIAVTNPNLRVVFNGVQLRPKPGRDIIKSTYFYAQPVSAIEVNHGTFKSTFYLAPGFHDGPGHTHTLVNNIPTFRGGTHVDMFQTHFFPRAMTELEKYAKRARVTLRRDDITTGLLTFGVVTMKDPAFDSQTKTYMVKEVKEDFKAGFDGFAVGSAFRRNPQWVDGVIATAKARKEGKENQKVRQQQRKLAKTNVAKLSDANGKNRDKCILFLMEGDSAVSNFPSARDPEIHGFLPLRGKILNVHSVKPSDAMKSEALRDIMTAMGLMINNVPKDLRYGEVWVTPDEDDDGKNIFTQVAFFFFRYWPQLFRGERPRVYKFCTPFVVLTKGKKRKYIYADDYAEFQANIDQYKGWDIRRLKGLGGLEPEDWEYALENPVLVPMIDDGQLKEVFDLIFNPARADDRKEWLADV